MQKLEQFSQRLSYCYAKVPYLKYFNSSEDAQEEICRKEREDLSEYLNSDSMNFENVLKERINALEVIEKKTAGGSYTIPVRSSLSHYLDY